jgi:hypothetical protein
LNEVDKYEVEYSIAAIDSADIGYDLYSVVLANALGYANLLPSYGELRLHSVSFQYVPYFAHSTLITDSSIGAFGVRQGVFDVTVATKTAANVLRLPGSLMVTNKERWNFTTMLVNSPYFTNTTTNLVTTIMPKVNFYFGWFTPSTTNSSAGRLLIRVYIHAKSKID